MTPADAKTKWCPYVAIAISMSGSSWNVADNRGGTSQTMTPNTNVNCLADGCMCWRWFGDTDGFCGLAGRPAA
jgi:hypothetical protein